MYPSIRISDPNTWLVPREIVSEGEKWIKHVRCESARFHVLSYSTLGTHCSEPDCIVNKPEDLDAFVRPEVE